MKLATAIGAQLARPYGWQGRLLSLLMRLANGRVTRLAINALDVRPGNTVVDPGCGSGDAIGILLGHAQGGLVIGIDHSPLMIASAQRCHPTARCHVAVFQSLPLDTASVDRILATNVAYFWDDDRAIMAEIRRVLRPGGKLSVYITDASALARLGLGRSGTHRLFDADTLAEIIGEGSEIHRVNAGWGVRGWLATLKRRRG